MYLVRHVAAAILVLAFCTMSFARSWIYLDETSLWFDTAVKSPNKARPQNNLGHALKNAGKIDEALPWFERALALDPAYPDAINNLAIILNQQGRKPEALDLLRRTLELNPGHLTARSNLAMHYYEAGRLSDARREYVTITELSPLSKEAAFARKMLAIIR